MQLAINPHCTAEWVAIDDHGTHALVVDEFLIDAPGLRAHALELAYDVPAAPDNYPGLKAYASLAGARETKAWAAERVLARLFGDQRPPYLRTDVLDPHGAFSIFACDRDHPPAGIEDQHTDGFAWLASVLHLSTVSDGRGTAFWEHRASGLQQWLMTDPVRMHRLEGLGLKLAGQLARMPRTLAANASDVAQLFRNPAGRRPFTTDEDATWRRLAYVPARFNRLVVYPTWQIHSVVDTSPIDHPTREDARLTFNQMIEYPLARELTRARPAYPAAFYRSLRQ